MTTRKEYIDNREKQLREWNTQLNELGRKSERHSQVLIKKWTVKIKELREKRLQLQLRLEEIKNSREDAFDNLKQDTDLLWKEVKAGFSEIRIILK